MSSQIMMNPIGLIKRKGNQIYLQIHESYRLGLKTITDFSHIWILWWMHKLESEQSQLQIVPNFPNVPQDGVGIFLTRSTYRPNRIGLSIGHIMNCEIKKGRVEIEGIDADHDSPILDIKPYLPKGDALTSDSNQTITLPKWAENLSGCFEDPVYRKKRDAQN
ncbi:MAG: TrmO family methyltransferase domain-containing protein [Candidatus Ranarchaeia archaeon]|jgi:tRNA-Thr(GGU) m(6)t(6)A37 methyltransferase TsaA